MSPKITKSEARIFIKRWKAVNDVEREELHLTTVEQKCEQLIALMSSVAQIGWDKRLREEDTEVRNRWNLLRAKLCSEKDIFKPEKMKKRMVGKSGKK
ncbi:MAG: hypothetical protein ACHQYP_11890 [Nitrospiria bacterium]